MVDVVHRRWLGHVTFHRRMRAKLGPEHESLIGTVRNVGYRFVPRKAPGTESETQLRETGTARADR